MRTIHTLYHALNHRLSHLQYSEEGYDVVQIFYPPSSGEAFATGVQKAKQLTAGRHSAISYALITFGIDFAHFDAVTAAFGAEKLKVVIHNCPVAESAKGLLVEDSTARHIP